MPKSKKPNNPAEEKKTAWRTPVKLPTIAAAVEPMKSLYAPDGGAGQAAPKFKDITVETDFQTAANENAAQEAANQPQQSSDLIPVASSPSDAEKPPTASPKRRAKAEPSPLTGKQSEAENQPANFGEAEFLRLLRTEKMDFYSLAEILRGSSMALYCVLYSESLGKGENRCQMRQNELMMRVGINNPATLYKQERWLTALHLISKSVRPGNHNGASYEVRPLETLPLPSHILEQFGGYLAEFV